MSKRKPYEPPVLTPPLTREEMQEFLAYYQRIMEFVPTAFETYSRTVHMGRTFGEGHPRGVLPNTMVVGNPGTEVELMTFVGDVNGWHDDVRVEEWPIPISFFTDEDAALQERARYDLMAEQQRKMQEEWDAQMQKEAKANERKLYEQLKKKYEK